MKRRAPAPLGLAPPRKHRLRSLAILAGHHPRLASVVVKVHMNGLSMLGVAPLCDLATAVADLEDNGPAGAIVEAGTALGGSAIILGRAKSEKRPLFLYDAFGMIPPPSERDDADAHARYEVIASGAARGRAGGAYYGYHEDLFAEVRSSLEAFGLDLTTDQVTMIPGLYEDTMHLDYPVALAHVDCDWYDSVLVCLEALEPHLVSGGRLVIDDYWAWSGCRRAVDEFFANRRGYRFVARSRLHVLKD